MKKTIVIYPFLLALYPILFFFAYNIDEFYFLETIIPMAISLGATILLWFTVNVAAKNSHKTGLILSILLVFFFAYPHVYLALWRIDAFGAWLTNHIFLAPIWLLICFLCIWRIFRVRKPLEQITKVSNLITLILISVPLIQLGLHFLINPEYYNTAQRKKYSALTEEDKIQLAKVTKPAVCPDIYYIIVDGYASNDVLGELYSFDNSEFLDFLTQKGFYIASESQSNYSWTRLSLASSLNFEYLKMDSSGALTEKSVSPKRTNSRAAHFLKTLGYKIIYTSSVGNRFSQLNSYADITIENDSPPNQFPMAMLEHSGLILLLDIWPDLRKQDPSLDIKRRNILNIFEQAGKIPTNYATIGQSRVPIFAFIHIYSPHPVYVFDRDGNHIMEDPLSQWTVKGHVEQTIFTNKKLIHLISQILADLPAPPLIILQGDHGPLQQHIPGKRISGRMGILNAYHFPGKKNTGLYQAISPVNSFRLLFNLYFGTEYPILKDEGYFSETDTTNELIKAY
ncbi:hypothetical protein HY605_02350 [Candidatus Peregrinibacteria bacterium]|nr:hypothetical protein [Candidatus Peregrinibacteria bacterium]